jgi:interferon gamma-inducible protein 30
MELNCIPFGNAELDPTEETVHCQHGPGECDANLWEQCAIEQASSPVVYVEFIACLEDKLPMGYAQDVFPESLFEGCADGVMGIDFNAMKKCHDNPMMRWQLQQKYAMATPEHDYVPWIVVNGRKMNEETENLLEVVCKEYISGGGTSPPGCSSSAAMTHGWN